MNITNASWGIERERGILKEVLQVPAIMKEFNAGRCCKLAALYDKIKTVVSQQGKEEKELLILFGCEQKVDDLSEKLKSLRLSVDDFIFKILGLSEKEQIIISDWVEYSMDMFESGLGSHVYNQTALDENKQYADLLCGELNTFLQSSNSRVGATVYHVGVNDPLNMIKLHFAKKECGVLVSDDRDLKQSLKEIDKYLLRKKAGDGLYVRKQIIHYKDDKIYIIKQNQKRFWMRTQAIIDAGDIIQNIMAMENA